MFTAEDQATTVPSDISFPTLTSYPGALENNRKPTVHCSTKPTVPFDKTQKTNNHNNYKSSKTPSQNQYPPEDKRNLNLSSGLLSYSVHSYHSPMKIPPKSTTSNVSQSTISSHLPPTAPHTSTRNPTYASKAEVHALRDELQQFRAHTTNKMVLLQQNVHSAVTSI